MSHTVVVYSLAGCPHCKNVKAFLAKHDITYTNFDVSDEHYADEMIALSGQRGVPVTVIDNSTLVIGDDLKKLEKLLLDATQAPIPAPKSQHDLIIIGAGPAGLSAALYAGRKQIDTLVISGATGGMATRSTHIENYPGMADVPGEELMKKIAEQATASGAVFLDDTAMTITRKNGVFTVETLNGDALTARTVIAATGRSPRMSGAKGESDFFGKGVAICTTCDGPFYKNKTVAIVGGGNTALDMALELADIAAKVHFIARSKIRGDEVLISRLEKKNNVEFHIGYTLDEIYGSNFVEGVVIKKKNLIKRLVADEPERITVDGVFLGIGLDPNTAIFDGFVPMNEAKEIIVDNNCSTDIPGFFAAGDATSIQAKQIASSIGEGVKALLSADAYLKKMD